MFEMRFRIPENLDIENLIELNSIEFYRNKLKKEKLIFICDALLNSRAKHRKQIEKKRNLFVPLSSNILQEVAYDYKKYLDFLLKTKIILTDNHFRRGIKCFGYRFTDPYTGQRNKTITVSSYSLKKARSRAIQKRNQELKKELRRYRYITKWWDSGLLKIDVEAAHMWLDQYEIEKIQIIKNEAIPDKEFRIKMAIETTVDFKTLVNAINYHKATYSFSGKSHRFYNPITNIKKELRDFLTYDGQRLVEIDLKNSQPFFATCLLDLSFWESTKKLNLKNINKGIYNTILKNLVFEDIITLLKSPESLVYKGIDAKKYSNLVINGHFYEYLSKHFKLKYPDRFNSRNNIKQEVLRIFFVENRKINLRFYRPCQTFSRHFPTISKLFYLIKSVETNFLPIILQSIESYLFLDIICKGISIEHPNIPIFTVHDSIITTEGNEKIVNEIIIQEIENWTGFKPTTKINNLWPMKIAV